MDINAEFVFSTLKYIKENIGLDCWFETGALRQKHRMEDQELYCPKDIIFDDLVTTLKCHPNRKVTAAGLISGDILLHSFSNTEENQELRKLTHHKKSCRALSFSSDGRRLFSASRDRSICCVDIETGKKRRIQKAHESPIYSLALSGEKFVATGDDDGVLKVWDMRTKDCVMEMKECEDYISDLIAEDNKKIIIASSGEGTLTSFNIRRKRVELQSELFDSELMCMATVKNGRKLACGTGDGVINLFHWNQWGNISDRYPCRDSQIDSMVAVTEDILCVGSSDGCISAVHILPNRTLGVIGHHMEDFPVEALSLTTDGTCIASSSHDQRVKFWNVEEIKSQTVDTTKKATKEAKKVVKKFGKAKKNDFFAGLMAGNDTNAAGGSQDDDDDDDDSD